MNSSNKSEYGKILARLIKEKEMTQEVFYKKLGITKPYFYEILSGKINPPPPDIQIKIIKILDPQKTDKKKLLDIAARDRGEIPADVLYYLNKNKCAIDMIRKEEKYNKIIGGIINGKEKN